MYSFFVSLRQRLANASVSCAIVTPEVCADRALRGFGADCHPVQPNRKAFIAAMIRLALLWGRAGDVTFSWYHSTKGGQVDIC